MYLIFLADYWIIISLLLIVFKWWSFTSKIVNGNNADSYVLKTYGLKLNFRVTKSKPALHQNKKSYHLFTVAWRKTKTWETRNKKQYVQRGTVCRCKVPPADAKYCLTWASTSTRSWMASQWIYGQYGRLSAKQESHNRKLGNAYHLNKLIVNLWPYSHLAKLN